MTSKMKKFCMEYASTGNATLSAKNAGYSEKTAYSQGQRLLKMDKVQRYLKQLSEEIRSSKIAGASEMQEYLTSIIRGEVLEEVIVSEMIGGGVSRSVVMKKKPSFKDAIRAVELLAKMQGLFTDTNILTVFVPVFSGEEDLE